MSEERYEIRGKIGAGGVGAVYRAFDKNLNREVALKRVLPDGGHEFQEEGTRQLLKEATALSSIQHPHIVTVYDAGVDHDGPYVVMELITGRTIDSLIEQGTLTWEDFREVALQTQEALIAAQDLNLVHRDLKPGNVMISWLPSGKFQIKIVDFGLAKFSSQPSLQTIDQGDAVFGSIYFMAPEQFERVALDQRVDMYSMGSLYYYCLTGEYPFTGDSAALVMAAHLQHLVEPLHEKRPDIPAWAADWVMWHIERDRDNRPTGARQAMESLLAYERRDKEAAAAALASATAASGAADAARAKSLFPVASGGPVAVTAPTGPQRPSSPAMSNPLSSTTKSTRIAGNHTAPQPLLPPEGSKPSVHTSPLSRSGSIPVHAAAEAPPAPAPAPVAVAAAAVVPVPAAPAAVAVTAARPMPARAAAAAPGMVRPAAATAAAAGQAVPGRAPSPSLTARPAKKGGLRAALHGPRMFIAAALTALIGIGIYYLVGAIASSRADAKIADIVKRNEEGQSVALTQALAQSILDRSTAVGSTTNRTAIFSALSRATASGDWDLDNFLVEAATRHAMAPEVRAEFLDHVIAPRATAAAVEPLIELALREEESAVGKAALRATRKGASAREFDKMLEIIVNRGSLREEAEAVAAAIVGTKRSDAPSFSRRAVTAYQFSRTPAVRQSLLRLLGHTGDPGSKDLITTALKTGDEATRLAAILAIQTWPDDALFPVLVDAITTQNSAMVRGKAFDSAIAFLKANRERGSNANLWPSLIPLADADGQKADVITGLFNESGSWRLKLLEPFTTGRHSETIKKQALAAISKIPK